MSRNLVSPLSSIAGTVLILTRRLRDRLSNLDRHLFDESTFLGSLKSIGLLLVVFIVADRCLMQACRLEPEDFQAPVLLLGYFKRSFPIGLAIGIGFAITLLLNFIGGLAAWKQMEYGGRSE